MYMYTYMYYMCVYIFVHIYIIKTFTHFFISYLAEILFLFRENPTDPTLIVGIGGLLIIDCKVKTVLSFSRRKEQLLLHSSHVLSLIKLQGHSLFIQRIFPSLQLALLRSIVMKSLRQLCSHRSDMDSLETAIPYLQPWVLYL